MYGVPSLLTRDLPALIHSSSAAQNIVLRECTSLFADTTPPFAVIGMGISLKGLPLCLNKNHDDPRVLYDSECRLKYTR
jgi:hypothetical protein